MDMAGFQAVHVGMCVAKEWVGIIVGLCVAK